MTITCPKLAMSYVWARKTLMGVSLAGKSDIIQCFQRGTNTPEGGACVMGYEVYCNQPKQQCLKHNPYSQGIYNLVSKSEGNFKPVSNCHGLLKRLEEGINCPEEQGKSMPNRRAVMFQSQVRGRLVNSFNCKELRRQLAVQGQGMSPESKQGLEDLAGQGESFGLYTKSCGVLCRV